MKKAVKIMQIDSNIQEVRHFLDRYADRIYVTFDPVDSYVGITVPIMGRGQTATYYLDLTELFTAIFGSIKDYVEERID